jgi:hypothetical protein
MGLSRLQLSVSSGIVISFAISRLNFLSNIYRWLFSLGEERQWGKTLSCSSSAEVWNGWRCNSTSIICFSCWMCLQLNRVMIATDINRCVLHHRNEYREHSLEVKRGRRVRQTTSPPSVRRLSRTVVFNIFFCVPPDAISLQLCTPKVIGI